MIEKAVATIPEYTTVSETVRFTGLNPRTIKKRVENLPISHTIGLNNFYKTYDVLRCCFVKGEETEQAKLVLSEEKAKYYKELTEKVMLEKFKMSGKLTDTEVIEAQQTKVRLALREKLLNLGAKVAPKIALMDDPIEITDALANYHVEILKEIGNDDEHNGTDQKKKS